MSRLEGLTFVLQLPTSTVFHIKLLVKLFGYFKDATGRQKIIVISPEDIGEISGKGDNTDDWLDNYPDVLEDIYEGLSEPRGLPLRTAV